MHSWKAAREIMAELSGSIMWNCKKIPLLWECGYHLGEEMMCGCKRTAFRCGNSVFAAS